MQNALLYTLLPSPGRSNMQIFHIMTPVVFRMLERRWVDKFFETGELRLSSFAQFAKHTDEQRKDKEGNNTITLRGASTTGFARIHGSGSNAYVLCSTALEPSRALVKAFNYEAAIQIFDAMGFAIAITQQVPNFLGLLVGHCVYTARSIQMKVEDVDIESFQTSPGSNVIDLNKATGFFLNAASTAVYFRKAATPTFIDQAEYRWVFLTSEAVRDNITINVPEARQYCLPWYPEENEECQKRN
jgi:hypothetical protein